VLLVLLDIEGGFVVALGMFFTVESFEAVIILVVPHNRHVRLFLIGDSPDAFFAHAKSEVIFVSFLHVLAVGRDVCERHFAFAWTNIWWIRLLIARLVGSLTLCPRL
jgi:hypothetical protein